MSDKCPKCKAGTMQRESFNSANWRCNVCGYKEYRSPPRVDTTAARASRRSAASSFDNSIGSVRDSIKKTEQLMKEQDRARKAKEKAESEQRKAYMKAHKGATLFTVILFIVIFYLLYNGSCA